MSALIISAVDAAFRGHGLTSTIVGEEVHAQDGLRLAPFVRVTSTDHESVMVQLDVRAASPLLGDLLLWDSFAGLGATQAEAEKNAFAKFLLGSFHVLAEALTEHKCSSEQVEWFRWSGPKQSWRVCSGPLLTQSTAGNGTAQHQYAGFLDRLGDLFATIASGGPHWCSIFVGFVQGQLSALQVSLNGESWPAAEALIQSVAWSPTESYETLRHILVAFPHNEQSAN